MEQRQHSTVTDQLIQKVNQVMCENRFMISDLSDEFSHISRISLFKIVTERLICQHETHWLDTLVVSLFDKGHCKKLVPQYDKCLNSGDWENNGAV